MPSRLQRVQKGLARRVRRRLVTAPQQPPGKPARRKPDAPPEDEQGNAQSLTFDAPEEARTWLVLFGGRKNRVGLAPFEFFNITHGIPTKRLFVRDLSQAWYHQGAGEAGDSIEQVAQSLERALDGHEHDRVVVAGLSAGGYAALLFGALLQADVVLAFSPQTVIDPRVLTEMDDQRWKEPLEELEREGKLDARWVDLRDVLPAARTEATRLEVHYDATFALDRLHAERIAPIDGVHLYPREGGGHNVPKAMRESGELPVVLRRALSSDHGPLA